MDTQEPNGPFLKAVSARIGEAIMAFAREHAHRQFHADDLHHYVDSNVAGGCAPASADRVLRDLRQKKRLNYVVVNRAKSLYYLTQVETEAAPCA